MRAHRCVFVLRALLVVPIALGLGACTDDGADDEKIVPDLTYCTPGPFAKVTESALFDAWNDRLIYSAKTSETEPYDRISIYSYASDPTGIQMPGRYELLGSTMEDCGTCVLSFKNCQDGSCEQMFYGGSGALIVADVGDIGEKFEGRLDNVLFREIEWNASDGKYEYVGIGEDNARCGHQFSFDLAIEEKVASASCVERGSGSLLGDNIANFSLQNCAGEWVELHDYCGNDKAIMLMLISGWCSACHQLVPEIETNRNLHDAEGLEVLYIMGEDDNEARPTLSFCQEYAQNHGVDPSRMFVDYGENYPWETFFAEIYPYIGDSFGVPWFAVLDGRNLQYVYNDSVGPGTLDGAVNSLLNRP